MAYIGSGLTRFNTADDLTVTDDAAIQGELSVDGAVDLNNNLDVDGGTIKLDGNYPVGTNNVALGDGALDSVTSGGSNTAIGNNALTGNTTGGSNTALGASVLRDNTSGFDNTSIGVTTLRDNTTGTNNTATGTSALLLNTTGSSNTANGVSALRSNTTASRNTAVGYQAGYSNQTGTENTFVGRRAGYNTTDNFNTAIGNDALFANTTGTNNTAVGLNSGSAITTGSKNTILGTYNGNQGGLDIRTSSNNIVLSDGDGNARYLYSGSNNATAISIGNNIVEASTADAFHLSGTADWRILEDGNNIVAFDPFSGLNRIVYFRNSGVGNITVNVQGALTKSSGSFKIDHPLPEKTDTHHLVHSFVEAPQADNIYRGKVDLVGGIATVNIDTVAGMTDGTFDILNREVQCFTSNESGWTAVRGSVSGNILTIEAQDNTCTDTISWLVVGERKDQHMYDTDWTDENGKVIVEPLKPDPDAEIITEELN